MDHILKKAMPGLHAFIEDHENEALFRQAMDVLEETLIEEERFSGGEPMKHKIESIDITPAVTMEALHEWANGKNYPPKPLLVAQKIYSVMRKNGVELPESTKVRRERQLQELDVERAGFGPIMTNPGLATDTPTPMPTPAPKLAARMQAVPYHPLLAALLAWSPSPTQPPIEWLRLIAYAMKVFPQDIFQKVVEKINGLSVGRLDAWVQGAQNAELAAKLQWPPSEAQALVVKHTIGFLFRIELETPDQRPEILSVRMNIASRLLDQADWDALAGRVRNHIHSHGRWNAVTLGYLGGLISGSMRPPDDPVMMVVIQNEMTPVIQERFKAGRWP